MLIWFLSEPSKNTLTVSLEPSWGYLSKSTLKLKLGVNSHSFCSFHLKEQDTVGRMAHWLQIFLRAV